MPSLRKHPGIVIALLLLLAAAGIALVRARGPVVETTRARRQDLEQHVVASGRVWVPARISISAARRSGREFITREYLEGSNAR